MSLLPTQMVRLRGHRVRLFLRQAQAGKPTALLLHGYPDTVHVFGPLASALPQDWGVVAADFPGQGLSENAQVFSPSARAEWLTALLWQCQATEKIVVFGHDMGAHAALELARNDALVRRVVLCHSLLDGTGPTSLAIRVLRRSGAYRVILPAVPQTVVSRCLATFLPGPSPLEAVVESDFRTCFSRGGALRTAAICSAAEHWLAQGLETFDNVNTEVRLLWGTAESHFPIAHAQALQRVLPKAQLQQVPGGYHWLAWHAPQAVAASLREGNE